MPRRYRIFAIIQLLLMLSINIGISYYAHTCESSGEQIILFSLENDPCTEPVVDKHEKESCCSESNTVEEHVQDNCCKTVQYVWQASDQYTNVWFQDLIQLVSTALPSEPLFFAGFTFEEIKEIDTTNWYLTNAPPLQQGRAIHQLIERYTI